MIVWMFSDSLGVKNVVKTSKHVSSPKDKYIPILFTCFPLSADPDAQAAGSALRGRMGSMSLFQ